MSGSASRSQFSRFVKRRLMLLILKLAIFIGHAEANEALPFSVEVPALRFEDVHMQVRNMMSRVRKPLGGRSRGSGPPPACVTWSPRPRDSGKAASRLPTVASSVPKAARSRGLFHLTQLLDCRLERALTIAVVLPSRAFR